MLVFLGSLQIAIIQSSFSFVLVLMASGLFSQIPFGYYINDRQEKLIISEDSIHYKLDSYGAITFRTIGRGKIIWAELGRKCRLKHSSWPMFEIVEITGDSTLDSIQVCLLNSNDSLIGVEYHQLIHLNIKINNKPEFILGSCTLDSSGCGKFLFETDSIRKFYEMHFLIGAFSMGGVRIDFYDGNEYVIRSKLDLMCEVSYEGNWREKFYFEATNTDKLKVYDHRVKKWKEFYLCKEIGDEIDVNWILQCE